MAGALVRPTLARKLATPHCRELRRGASWLTVISIIRSIHDISPSNFGPSHRIARHLRYTLGDLLWLGRSVSVPVLEFWRASRPNGLRCLKTGLKRESRGWRYNRMWAVHPSVPLRSVLPAGMNGLANRSIAHV
jgi:hypothetical protein